MMRKYENKRKLSKNKPARSIKRTKDGKNEVQILSPQIVSSSELDYTLPEGNHLDSFDNFCLNQLQVLKEKKVLKKDVRASFNRDSSFEMDSTCSMISMLTDTTNESLIMISDDEENNDPNPVKAKNLSLLTFLHLKPAYNVPPIDKHLMKRVMDKKTSTPERFFAEANVSSILAYETDQSTANLGKIGKANSRKTKSNEMEKVQPAYVATRRPRPVHGKQLTYSTVEQTQVQQIDDKMFDDATTTSIVSVMDMSSIVVDGNEEIDELKCDSFNLNKSKCSNNLNSRTKIEGDNHEMTINGNDIVHTTNNFEEIETNNSFNITADKEFITNLNRGNASAEVSSTSITATISTASPSISVANQQKNSMKPHVGFDISNSIHELSAFSQHNESSQKLVMKSGKWRRTIFEARRNKVTQSPRRVSERKSDRKSEQNQIRPSQVNVLRRKSILIKDIPDRKTINRSYQTVTVLDESDVESICSVDFSPKSTPINVLSKLRSNRLQSIADSVDIEHYQRSTYNTGSQLSLCNSSSLESVVNEIEKSTASLHLGVNHDGLKLQLLKRCGQSDVLPFDEIYSASVLKKCRKIGEGVFGEVFLNETSSRSSYVLKIIPIEGRDEINGAQQKRFDEILQEVIISQELSALRNDNKNRSSGFVEVLNVRLIEGRYPAHLLDLWNDYDTRQGSENDCPVVFGDDQLYVVFELANCGSDLEAHVFKNAEQSFSAFKQVALSLAVAESQFEFEHRDLHWGNVLVAPTIEKTLTFYLNGKSIEIRTHGIKATIIDYTLSRLVYKNCCLFQDLAADPELFDATGDYQYDIYRLMRTRTQNYWEIFEPFTNVLWLHYTIDKMIGGVNYTAKKGVKHRQFIDKMIKLRDELLDYRSASDYIETNY